MNKRKIFLHSLNRFRMAGAVIAVMLFAACDDEQIMGVRSNGDTICFNPMQQTDEWNELPQSRSAGNAHSGDAQSADTTYVVKLDCETPDGKPLYLHVQVTDGIECAGTEAMTEDAPATRGIQVTGADNFHDTFGMYAVSYEQWNPTQDYNLMRNLKVEKRSNWQTDIKWPTKGRVDFYAYAPHSDATGRNFNITYSKHTTEEGPIFHVRQTDAISPSESPDLMLASPGGFNAGNGGNPVRLNFKHVLSAIKIRTHQTEFFKGRLESLKILNACRDADFHLKPSAITISNRGNRGPITLVQNSTANIDKDQELISHGGAFFMIPQAINNDNPVELEIKFAPEGKPAQTTKIQLSAPDGGWWFQSRTYTYTLSNSENTPNPEWDYTFEVANGQSDFYLFYHDKILDIPIKSYSNEKGNTSSKKSIDWTFAYSTDNGNSWKEVEGNNVSDIGEAMFGATKFIPAGSDGTNHYLRTITNYEPKSWKNVDDQSLYDAGDNGRGSFNPEDLSKPSGELRTTANCYIVNKAGWYMFPTVYGCAIKNGVDNKQSFELKDGIPTDNYRQTWDNSWKQWIWSPYIYKNCQGHTLTARLLWSDSPNLVTNIAMFADNDGGANTGIRFEVPRANIKQGNAVIAVYDETNAILWQWHIWVTPYGASPRKPLDQFGQINTDYNITNREGVKYQMMSLPVGHCTGEVQEWSEKSILLRFTQKATGTQKQLRLLRQSFRKRKPGTTPTYQWGRACPFPAGMYTQGSDWNSKCEQKPCTFGTYLGWDRPANDNRGVKNHYGQVNTYYSQLIPLDLIADRNAVNYNEWSIGKYRNRWDMACRTDANNNATGKVIKTIFDPSPRGYAMPTRDAFTGFVRRASGTDYEVGTLNFWASPIKGKASYEDEYGVQFRVNPEGSNGKTIFIPATGYRNANYYVEDYSNYVYNAGNKCAYWTATYSSSNHKAYGLDFGFDPSRNDQPYIYTRRLQHTADCYGVISVRE